MSDERNTTENEPQGGQKTRGGKGETGTAGRSIQANPAIFEVAQRFGLSMEQVTKILREWAHLAREELSHRLSEFSRDISRASAHMVVEIDRNMGFTLVIDFIRTLGGKDAGGAAFKQKPQFGMR